MITKCRCQHCNVNVEFDDSQAGENVSCPNCGMETVLFVPTLPQPKPIIPSSSHPVQIAREHLRFIRNNSCYGALRSLIEICFALCMGLAGLLIIGAFIVLFKSHGDYELTGIQILTILGACVAEFILYAGRQSAFLLIDIADTLIHEHSKSSK